MLIRCEFQEKLRATCGVGEIAGRRGSNYAMILSILPRRAALDSVCKALSSGRPKAAVGA